MPFAICWFPITCLGAKFVSTLILFANLRGCVLVLSKRFLCYVRILFFFPTWSMDFVDPDVVTCGCRIHQFDLFRVK